MPDPRQLPYLLKLLDDETPAVRRDVLKELAAYGQDLESSLARLDEPPSESVLLRLRFSLEEYFRENLRLFWESWLKLPESPEKLERGHEQIGFFQQGLYTRPDLRDLLDQLAEDYRRTEIRPDPITLAHFLFVQRKLTGAKHDFYHPLNSNLISVILDRRGIPISLAVVYMLVGSRLGMAIEGCNYPGHFLARVRISSAKVLFVDCFHGGQLMSEDDVMRIRQDPAYKVILDSPADAELIMARVLSNLVNAYHHAHQEENAQLMQDLLDRVLEFRHDRQDRSESL